MNILIFGAGVYVRGSYELTSPLGNLGGALAEGKRARLIDKVFIVSTSNSADFAARKINNSSGQDFAFSSNLEVASIARFIQETNVTVAVVALPDDRHYEHIRICGEAGLHVISVKPFVETVKQADHLIALFKSKGTLGCVEFHKRFDKDNLLLRECLLPDEIISRIFVDYSQDKSVALQDFASWASRSNIFQYLGVHYVDLVHWFTGANPVSVSAFKSGVSLKGEGLNVDDNIDVVIEWQNKGNRFNSFHLTSWAENHKSYCPSRQKIEILTNTRRIESDQAYRGFKVIDRDGGRVINPYFSKPLSINGSTRYFGYGIESYLTFFMCIKERRGSFGSFEDIDDRLCTFESARCSVLVTELVRRRLDDHL